MLPTFTSTPGLARYWYGASIRNFLHDDTELILGKLAFHAGDGHFVAQRDAWLYQIAILHHELQV